MSELSEVRLDAFPTIFINLAVRNVIKGVKNTSPMAPMKHKTIRNIATPTRSTSMKIERNDPLIMSFFLVASFSQAITK